MATKSNLFSQLVMCLMVLEESIEETMYFALFAKQIHVASDKSKLSLPDYLLGQVKQQVTTPMYFDYFKSRTKKVIDNFPSYANLYAVIKLSASWESFLIECILIMKMGAPVNNWTLEKRNETMEEIHRDYGNKGGVLLLKELDRLCSLGIVSDKDFANLESIYKIRDCIAHRNGIVSKWDFDKKCDVMITSWDKAMVKGKQSIPAWDFVGKTKFTTLLMIDKREWFENQIVSLSSFDVCNIGLNLMNLGYRTFNELVAKTQDVNKI